MQVKHSFSFNGYFKRIPNSTLLLKATEGIESKKLPLVPNLDVKKLFTLEEVRKQSKQEILDETSAIDGDISDSYWLYFFNFNRDIARDRNAVLGYQRGYLNMQFKNAINYYVVDYTRHHISSTAWKMILSLKKNEKFEKSSDSEINKNQTTLTLCHIPANEKDTFSNKSPTSPEADDSDLPLVFTPHQPGDQINANYMKDNNNNNENNSNINCSSSIQQDLHQKNKIIHNINAKSIIIKKLIGKGSFGNVYKGTRGTTKVALKQIKIDSEKNSKIS